MVIKVTFKKRNLIIALLVIVAIITTIFAIYLFKQTHSQTQNQYYIKQLTKLKNDTSTIDLAGTQEQDQSALSDQIKSYDEALADILNTCQDVNARYNAVKADPKVKPLLDRMNKTGKLCEDLQKVTGYAREQSDTTRDFVLFSADTLTTQQSSLPKFQGVLSSMASDLENLKQDPIKDPAVPEQLVLVQQMQQLAQDATSNPGKLDSLAKQVQTHQNNFLNARTYFWKNTIDIVALTGSIDALQNQFK